MISAKVLTNLIEAMREAHLREALPTGTEA